MVGEPILIGSDGSAQEFIIASFNSSTSIVVYNNATCTNSAFSVPGFASSGGTVPNLLNAADVALKRITISCDGSGSLTPDLRIEGTSVAASTLTVPSGNPYYVVIDWLGGSPGLTGAQYTDIYTETSGNYLLIGVDAKQVSSQTLVHARQVVNQQEIVKADGGTPDTDKLVGGFLQLAADTYDYEADQGVAEVCA